MKLDDVHLVGRMAELRRKLIAQRDDHKLRVTFEGPTSSEQLDPVIVAMLRPLVAAELDRRIALLDADLCTLGVRIG